MIESMLQLNHSVHVYMKERLGESWSDLLILGLVVLAGSLLLDLGLFSWVVITLFVFIWLSAIEYNAYERKVFEKRYRGVVEELHLGFGAQLKEMNKQIRELGAILVGRNDCLNYYRLQFSSQEKQASSLQGEKEETAQEKKNRAFFQSKSENYRKVVYSTCDDLKAVLNTLDLWAEGQRMNIHQLEINAYLLRESKEKIDELKKYNVSEMKGLEESLRKDCESKQVQYS